jgi:hypothetical protein
MFPGIRQTQSRDRKLGSLKVPKIDVYIRRFMQWSNTMVKCGIYLFPLFDGEIKFRSLRLSSDRDVLSHRQECCQADQDNSHVEFGLLFSRAALASSC